MNTLRACAATSWLGAGGGAVVAGVPPIWWASWAVGGVAVAAMFADYVWRLVR